MNESETMCERCEELPAETIVEHAEYGEAVCKCCVEDERWEETKRAGYMMGFLTNAW